MEKITGKKKAIEFANKKQVNKFKVIPISKLKDDKPVLAVTEYPNKSFAEFHLVERVIVPINSDWEL